MKSLEALKQLKDKHITSVTRRYYESGMPKFRRDEFYKMFDDELEVIKQDLEVLELLKKKKVNIFLVEVCIAVIGYNFSVEYDDGQPTLTREEFDKLEQWLEEQE